MADQFQYVADQVSAPATRVGVVTPSDAAPLADVPKALWVGTGGDLTVRGAGGGADAVLRNVPAGSVVPVRAQFVRATGTTVADIVALY